METDATLLTRYAQRHDAEAYAELARRYAALVYGTSLRIVRNPADAEDVTQDCFLTLARQAGQIRDSLAGWLHTTARTRSLDYLRSNRRRERREAAVSPQSADANGAWESIEPLVDEALEQLPEDLRLPIQLHFLAGRTQGEVARELGIGQATVSRRIDRGIAQLRENLAGNGAVASVAALGLGLSQMPTPPAGLGESLVKIGLAGMGKSAQDGTVLGGVLLMKKMLVAAVIVLTFLIGGYLALRSGGAAGSQPAPLATDTAPATTRISDLMDLMQPADGQWRRDGDAWVGSGASAHLILPRGFPSDALVVEFDAQVDVDGSARSMGCVFSGHPTLDESTKAQEIRLGFWLRGSYKDRYPWSGIAYDYATGTWSRERMGVDRFSSLSIGVNQSYHVKVERIGTMRRLWVDDVAVAEMTVPQPAPTNTFIWLTGMDSTNRFRNLKVYRPANTYMTKYSKPAPLFDPWRQRLEILAKYPDTIEQQASITLKEKVEPAGLKEVPFSGQTSLPAADRDGTPCRHFVNNDRSKGINLALQTPDDWDLSDDIYAEVEYLDDGPGAVAIMYKSWWMNGVASEDIPVGATGKWIKGRVWLPEANLPASGACLWLSGLRLPKEDLYLRSVRLVAVSKPQQAWDEVVAAYMKEIEQHPRQWTTPYYLLEAAKITHTKLSKPADARKLADRAAQEFPTSPAVGMYQNWKRGLGGANR